MGNFLICMLLQHQPRYKVSICKCEWRLLNLATDLYLGSCLHRSFCKLVPRVQKPKQSEKDNLYFYLKVHLLSVGTLSLGVSLCRYQFHPKPSPLGQTPGTRLERNKNPSPRDNHYVQRPLWTKQGVKSHPCDIKPKNFTNVCIYKLFEMN